MSLFERIERTFGNEVSKGLREFCVPDSVFPHSVGQLSVVLLLESPRIEEVSYGYPLAGYTGLYVGRFLGRRAGKLLPNEPVGRSVYERSSYTSRLGIMNASRFPLERKAYTNFLCGPELTDHWKDYMTHMNTIKGGAHVSPDGRRSDECKQLDHVINDDLKSRLECLKKSSPEVLIVRCGPVAQKLCDRTGSGIESTCNLPHPSRNGWRDLKSQEEKHFQDIICRLTRPSEVSA